MTVKKTVTGTIVFVLIKSTGECGGEDAGPIVVTGKWKGEASRKDTVQRRSSREASRSNIGS